MSIKGQGHSLTLVKGHSDFKVKCLTFGLYTQVSNSGPLGPLVLISKWEGNCAFTRRFKPLQSHTDLLLTIFYDQFNINSDQEYVFCFPVMVKHSTEDRLNPYREFSQLSQLYSK